jgi:hypothetical protein
VKKVLVGCLLALVLLGVLAAVGLYLAWEFVRPVIRTVSDVTDGVTRLGGLAEIEEGLQNTGAFAAPESGELTPAQVERFIRVQRQVRLALGTRGEAFAAKYRQMSGRLPDGSPRVPSLPELLGGVGDLSSVYLDAWRAQVQAMNAERFSRAEFGWVRARVYQAAGLDAVRYDARDLEEVIEAMARGAQVETPEVQLPDAPARNRALVKPHVAEVTAWLPMAVFGL